MLAVCALLFSSVPFMASARATGEFWKYSAFEDLSGINATGTFTYESMGHTDLLLGGTRYGVDAVRFSGELLGSGTVLLVHIALNASVSGTIYTSNAGMTVAKEDAFMFVNTTLGTGFPMVTHSETEVVTTYTPPQLLQFDISDSKPGDSWSEASAVNTTTTDYQNGTLQGRTSTTDDVQTSVDIAPSEETVTTQAGTFSTLKITVSRSNSDFTVYWWSAKVGNFVKMYEYSPGLLGSPVMVGGLTLTSFESERADTLVIVVIGVATVVVALVVIAAILTTRSRPGPPGAGRRGPDAPEGPPRSK